MNRKVLMTALALALPLAAAAQSKKELVAKVVQLQQPGIEAMGRVLVERPAMVMMQQAGQALQARIAPDKREEVGKAMQADVRKYLDEAVPIAREQAVKLAPSTLGALLEQRFSEDELKQLIAILESPVNRKFQQMGGELERALADKVVEATRGEIEPRLRSLEVALGKRLGAPAPATLPASGAAKPATAPKPKAAASAASR